MGLSDLLLMTDDNNAESPAPDNNAPTISQLIQGIGKAEGWGAEKYDSRTRAPYGLIGDVVNHPEIKTDPQAAKDFMRYKLTNPKSATYVPGLVNADDTINVDKLPQLRNKWAPVGADNDPNNLNSNWLKNVSKNIGASVPDGAATDESKYDGLMAMLDNAFPKKKPKPSQQSGGGLMALADLTAKKIQSSRRPGVDIPDFPFEAPQGQYPLKTEPLTEADAIAAQDKAKDDEIAAKKEHEAKIVRQMTPKQMGSYSEEREEEGSTDEGSELTASLEANVLVDKSISNLKKGKILQAATDFTDATRARMTSTGNPIMKSAAGIVGGIEKEALPVIKTGAVLAESMNPLALTIDLLTGGKYIKGNVEAEPNKEIREQGGTEKVSEEISGGVAGLAKIYGAGLAAPESAALQFVLAQSPSSAMRIGEVAAKGGDVGQAVKEEAIKLGFSGLTGAVAGPAGDIGADIAGKAGSMASQGLTFGGLAGTEQSALNEASGKQGSDIDLSEVVKQTAIGAAFGLFHQNPEASIPEAARSLKTTPLTPGDPVSIVDVVAQNAGDFEITNDMLKPLKKEGLVSKGTTVANIPPEIIQGVRSDHISRTIARALRDNPDDPESAINIAADKLNLSDEQRQAIFDHEGIQNAINKTSRIPAEGEAETAPDEEQSVAGAEPAAAETAPVQGDAETKTDTEILENQNLEGETNAANTGVNEQSSIDERQRASRGSDVPENQTEVRQEESRPASGSDSAGRETEEPEKVTGVKNAITDEERKAAGLPERETPEAGEHRHPDLQAKAIEEFKKDPNAGTDLIKKIKGGKMVNDFDQFLLGIEKEERGKIFESARKELSDAEASGNTDRLIEAEKKFGKAEDDYNEVFNIISDSGGTKIARSLAARNATINKEDYSYIEQQARTLAAINEGKPKDLQRDRLNRREREQVIESVNKVEKARIAAEDAQDSAASSQAQATFEEMVKRMVEGKPMRTGEKLRAHGSKIEAEGKAEWDAFLKSTLKQTNLNFDPTKAISSLAKIGYGKIAKGAASLAEFSKQMIDDLGDLVEPHLDEIYKASQMEFLKHSGEKYIETPEDILAKAKANADTGLEGNKTTIGKLVHAHLLLEKSGKLPLDRKDVVEIQNKVADDLRESFPDITARQVGRIYSDYGKVRIPGKKEINVQQGEVRRISQLIESLARADEGLNPEKSGQQRRPPTQEMLDLEKEIKDSMQRNGVEPIDKETQLASRLQRYKKQIDTKTAELKARNDAGNFSVRKREKTPLDEEAEQKVANYEREKNRHDIGVEVIRLQSRPTWQKISNLIPKITRFGVLSYPQTMAKLAVSALQIAGEAPAFTLESMILRSMLRNFAEESTILKGASFEGLKDAYVAAYKNGVRAAGQHIHLRPSDHEILFGDKADAAEGYGNQEKLDSPSYLHAIVKDPVKEMFFALSRSERIKHMETSTSQEAQDLRSLPRDKAIKQIEDAAWTDAKRAIYLDKNFLAQGMNGFLRTLRQMKNDEGTVNKTAQVFADLVQSQMPIVRIATNIPKRAAERIGGLPLGLVRLANWKIGSVMKKAMDKYNIPESKARSMMERYAKVASEMDIETANSITRNIERGFNGGVGFVLGYMFPQYVGGFYTGGKRDDSDVPVGSFKGAKILGADWGQLLGHTDMSVGIQAGSTFRRVADEKDMFAGGKEVVLGLAEHTPFVGLITNVGTLFHQDDNAAGNFFGQAARQMFVPGFMQTIASASEKTVQQDPNIIEQVFGQKVKRDKNGFLPQIESGLPVLNRTLPFKRSDYLNKIEEQFRSGSKQEASRLRIEFNSSNPVKRITPSEYGGIYMKSQKSGDDKLKIPEIERKISKAEEVAKPALIQTLSDKIDSAHDLTQDEKDALRSKYGLSKPVKEEIKSEIDAIKIGTQDPYDYELQKRDIDIGKNKWKKSILPRIESKNPAGYIYPSQ